MRRAGSRAREDAAFTAIREESARNQDQREQPDDAGYGQQRAPRSQGRRDSHQGADRPGRQTRHEQGEVLVEDEALQFVLTQADGAQQCQFARRSSALRNSTAVSPSTPMSRPKPPSA